MIASDEKFHLSLNTSHLIQFKALKQLDYSTDIDFLHDSTYFFNFKGLDNVWLPSYIHEGDIMEVRTLVLRDTS